MSGYKFAVGDRVEFSPGRFDGNVTRGLYTVTRRMPSETGERQYRVKSVLDSHERAVSESQLRKN